MKKRLGLVIDQERCIGCEACSVACRLENNAEGFLIRIETQDAARKDTPVGTFPHLSMDFLPRLCNHCNAPPCVEACPLEALVKREDGPVVLQGEMCDGCRACVDVCPYGAISYNPRGKKAEKCNMCIHRTDRGLEPFCVICCEGQAMHFGDLNDPASDVSRIIAERGGFTLDPDAGSGLSVYYCPPMKRRPM